MALPQRQAGLSAGPVTEAEGVELTANKAFKMKALKGISTTVHQRVYPLVVILKIPSAVKHPKVNAVRQVRQQACGGR